MKDILIFLTTGFEEIEALTCVDVLRRANLNVKMVSLEDKLLVASKHNIQVKSDIMFHDIIFDNIEMLILPGGTTKINDHQNLKDLLIRFNQQQGKISAICAAPMVLGELNLLNNKQATCYPGFEKYLLNANIVNTGVIVDGHIITAQGPRYSMDFALMILEKLTSKEIRENISKDLLF